MALHDFVLGDEIRGLMAESYEELPKRVQAAIQEDSKKLFGSSEPFQVLATFATHALILRESGEVFRVKYERSSKNEIIPIIAESFSKGVTVDQAAKTEAKAFVEAFWNGSKSLASSHWENLVKFLPEMNFKPREVLFAEAFEAKIATPKAWKKVFEDKKKEIFEAVAAEKQAAPNLAPKFRKLYDGSISKEELPSYVGLVTSDLKYLASYFEGLRDRATRGQGKVPALRESTSDPTIKLFESFALDYVQDVDWIQKTISEAIGESNPIDVLGKIYDVLTSEVHSYEVAANFVESMLHRLNETGTEDK